MKGLFSFGAPKSRRFAMQFGYEPRPSFWQEVRSNSHLVIAAAGTAALLGVAGVALWLALPANDRQAFANQEQAVAEPAQPVAAPLTATAETNSGQALAAPQAAPTADEISAGAAEDAALSALASNDPRWTKPKNAASKPAPSPAQGTSQAVATDLKASVAVAGTEPAAEKAAAAEPSKPAAPNNAAAAHSSPDASETAAIPTVKPRKPDAQAGVTGNGRIVRSVTMRKGPKKGAAAIGTVPAKTTVQVVGCKQWCQIVYNGKRGWIYKSFLKRGG